MIRAIGTYSLLAAVVAAAACEGVSDIDTDDGMGSISAAMHDSAAVLPANRTQPAPTDSVDYDGVLSGAAMMEIATASGPWVPVGVANVAFDVYCEQSGSIGSDVDVPVGTYERARLTLSGFNAAIEGGGLFWGVAVPGSMNVALGGPGATVEIEKSIGPIEVTDASRFLIAFDLNTEVWMSAGIGAAGQVGAADVQNAAMVHVTDLGTAGLAARSSALASSSSCGSAR